MSKRKLGHDGNSHELDEEDEEDEEDELIHSTQDHKDRPQKQQRVENGKNVNNNNKQITPIKRQQPPVSNGKLKKLKAESSDEESNSSGSEDDDENSSGSDSGSSDEEEEEDGDGNSEDERETVRREQQLKSGLTEPEAGIIESITLENFMCHQHFKLEFCSNVNFIAGENGSGKSAVLIALIVCLGAKAGFTNRGSKLSDLVKAETNTAVITVKLRNQGQEAFKPEKYGPSVIIERRISKTGASGYKVKDYNGRTVSDKFNDVSLILEQFNIQIDNPMSILTQDTSRQFLNSAGPQDKYKSFLMATQLDKMTKDYVTIREHIDKIKDMLSQKVVVIQELEKKVKAYNDEYKELQQMVGLERKISEFKNQLAWSFVVEAEREAKRKEKQVTDSEKETNFENDVKKIDENIEKHNTAINDTRDEIKEFSDQIKIQEQKKETNNREILTIEREEAKITTQIEANNKKRVQRKQRRHLQLQSINDIKERNAQLANNQSKLDEINKKGQQKLQLEARKEELIREKEDLMRERENIKKDYQNQRSTLQQMNKEYEGLRVQLNNLKSTQKGENQAYGKGMTDFLNKIQANRRMFSKLPIGPVGLNLKIKNENWAFAIESAITKLTLKNFLVYSIPDGMALQKLGQQFGIKVDFTKIPETNEVYKTLDHDELDPSIITVLRVLDSPSHAIINFLIDSKKVEQIGLGNNRKEIDQILYTDRCPRGLTQFYDSLGNNYSKLKSGNPFYQAAKNSGEATMLRVNSDAAIQRTQRDLDSRLPALTQQKKIEQELGNNIQSIERKIGQNDQDQNMCSRKILQVSNEIKFIEDTLVQQTDDYSELELGLASLDEEIKSMEEEINNQKAQRNEVASRKEPFINDNKALDDQIQVLSNQLGNIENGLRKYNDNLRRLMTNRQALLQQQDRNNRERNQLKDDYQKILEVVKETTEKATQICERVDVPPNETNTSLTNKIIQFTKQLEKESKGKRSRSEALKLFQDTNNSLKEISEQRDNISELAAILERNLNERYKKWQRFRLSISRRSDQYFNIFLSKKGYTGSLTFDHQNGKLDINVDLQKAMPSNQNGAAKGDTKGLSGGERSFSTVSLLLAFWENMECPFRAMDEFDVFMDEVNRSISINLLMSKAEENRSKQYIFVTPLALNSITASEYVKIFRVLPPIRTGGDVIVETE
ncbi:hypothetical protein ACTA71_001115 [Dictyostelium dimigraforme]